MNRVDRPAVSRPGRPAVIGLLASLAALAAGPVAIGQGGERWVGTWAASPVPPLPASPSLPANAPFAKLEFHDQTLRQIVRVSLGGDRVRIRLSNEYGSEPLVVGRAHVAVRDTGSSIVPGSDRALAFSGRPSIRVPAGAVVMSDPVALDVPAGGDLAVSMHLPGSVREVTWHPSAFQTSYVAPGDRTAARSLSDATTVSSWFFLTGVIVAAPDDAGAIVALGDSITDGANSKADTNGRWPDVLARRLRAAGARLAVLNAGIGGNRVLHDGRGGFRALFGVGALARFDRDVLAQPGVEFVVVLMGINDIGHPGTPDVAPSEDVSADDVIAGLRQLVERARAHGLRILGATLTPFEGTTFPGYYTPAKEATRRVVNEWIRTSGSFDGVIDFDEAVRDPDHRARLRPAYDSGDHLHPGPAGLEAMGEAIDLGLFRARDQASDVRRCRIVSRPTPPAGS